MGAAASVSSSPPPDTWAGLSTDEQWERLQDDEAHLTMCGPDDAIPAAASAAGAAAAGDTDTSAIALDLSAETVEAGQDLAAAWPADPGLWASRIVSLDLNGQPAASVRLVGGAAALVGATGDAGGGGSNVLRRLNLSGCTEVQGSGLSFPPAPPSAFARLLDLDLSFTDIVLDDGSMEFSGLSSLRRLNLEGCSLESLGGGGGDDGDEGGGGGGGGAAAPSGLGTLSALRYLLLSDNELEVDALGALGGLRGVLEELDLRENPCTEESVAATKAALGALLDAPAGGGRGTITEIESGRFRWASSGAASAAAAIGLDQVAGLKESMLAGDTVADRMEAAAEERCSCLDGNPCENKYTCKDWTHRHEVAKAARAASMHQSRLLPEDRDRPMPKSTS